MEQIDFIKSTNFMRVGQCIEHAQWENAMLAVRHLQKDAKTCEFTQFSRLLSALQTNIGRRDTYECKQILAQISARRAQYLNQQNNPAHNA